MITTIQIDSKTKQKLEQLKVHHRETYNELIARLIQNSNPEKINKESLIATIEVLSDPELMSDLREALQEQGGTPLEELEKEFNLNV